MKNPFMNSAKAVQLRGALLFIGGVKYFGCPLFMYHTSIENKRYVRKLELAMRKYHGK